MRNLAYLCQCLEQLHRCQQHYLNLESSLVADHMKKSVATPFLDSLISDISSRFSTHSKHIDHLLPKNIRVNTTIVDLNEAKVFYSELPNLNILMKNLIVGPNG